MPPNSLAVNDWVGHDAVRARRGRRHLRPARRLPDRPASAGGACWSGASCSTRFSALAAGFSTSVEWLLFWRCCTFVGVCVEFVAAVAWLAELFDRSRSSASGHRLHAGVRLDRRPDGHRRLLPRSSPTATRFPMIRGGHEAWRYTLMSGLIPAIPLIIIRPFLPESPAWAEKKRAGTLQAPELRASCSRREFRRTTIVTTVMMACVYAAAFGAIQQMPRIVPGLRGSARRWRARRRSRRSAASSRSRSSAGWPDASLLAVPRRDHHRPAPAALALPDSRASSSCRWCSS